MTAEPELQQAKAKTELEARRPVDWETDGPTSPERQLEQVEKLRSLAEEAKKVAARQKDAHKQLESLGFNTSGQYLKAERDRITAILQSERGLLTYRTEIAFPSGANWRPNEKALDDFIQETQGPDIREMSRFACGGQWYTLKRPLIEAALLDLVHDFGLSVSPELDQVQRHLHFRFQRLYRKRPEERTAIEASEWDRLLTHIDLEAYEAENPTPENRIGRLLSVNPDRVVIQWSTDGVVEYDSRDVPPELLVATLGWLVHAEIRILAGTERWLSVRLEPPVASEQETIEQDITQRERLSVGNAADAEWPRI